MRIGNVELGGYAALAPMAGVADRAFRELCMEFGAGYCVSEMVSSKGIAYNSKKSAELMELSDKERPSAVQLFGTEPDTMAQAAEFAMRYRPDVIDINMGCPAPKISGGGSGAALMRDPELCGRIVKAVIAPALILSTSTLSRSRRSSKKTALRQSPSTAGRVSSFTLRP